MEWSLYARKQIESFDCLLCDICSANEIFGGKIVVFAGDFGQVLPVIPRSNGWRNYIKQSNQFIYLAPS